MAEVWKAIEGYEGIYEVSDQGRVRNVKRGKVKKASISSNGYRFVLLLKGGERHTAFVHRLVAKAFIPNPEGKPQVNHIDGKKEHNAVDNLEWVTAWENILHAQEIGLRKGTSYTSTQESTPTQVIREEKGWSQEELAKKAGVSYYTIKDFESKTRIARERCVSTVYKIAKALGVSIETLAGYGEGGERDGNFCGKTQEGKKSRTADPARSG